MLETRAGAAETGPFEFAFRPSPNTNGGWPTLPLRDGTLGANRSEDNLRSAPELVPGGALAVSRNQPEGEALPGKSLPAVLGLKHA
jgi:hypothetical protein